jgi:hypothetical protein
MPAVVPASTVRTAGAPPLFFSLGTLVFNSLLSLFSSGFWFDFNHRVLLEHFADRSISETANPDAQAECDMQEWKMSHPASRNPDKIKAPASAGAEEVSNVGDGKKRKTTETNG